MPAPAAPADPRAAQFARVRALVAAVLPANPFYARKLGQVEIRTINDFAALPFTTKGELTADQQQHPPYGTNLTYPLASYCRFHQTSGTSTGQPLRWLDTAESWEWIAGCWRHYFALMGLVPGERMFFPFSFGPFLGFWSAYDAASRLGFLCIPGGGMSSAARLRLLLEHRCSVLFATPTYALHLAEVATAEGLDIAASAVRAIVVAGEPGGNIPATRERIETAWGARVFDHYGMTEVGPVAVEAVDSPGSMYLLECEYLAEVIDPATGRAAPDGEVGELVLTNLGRTGSPLIRYRTGDLVKLATSPDVSGRMCRRLDGGILGRADDMIHVRGNNLYPAAIEAIVRRFAAVVEYRVCVDHSKPLADLRIEIEPAPGAHAAGVAEDIARAVRDELLFRVEVRTVAPGTLPRFEMKARRVVRIDSEK